MDGSIDGRIDAWMAAGWLGGDMDGTKKHTRIGSCLHRYTCIKEKNLHIRVYIYTHTYDAHPRPTPARPSAGSFEGQSELCKTNPELM